MTSFGHDRTEQETTLNVCPEFRERFAFEQEVFTDTALRIHTEMLDELLDQRSYVPCFHSNSITPHHTIDYNNSEFVWDNAGVIYKCIRLERESIENEMNKKFSLATSFSQHSDDINAFITRMNQTRQANLLAPIDPKRAIVAQTPFATTSKYAFNLERRYVIKTGHKTYTPAIVNSKKQLIQTIGTYPRNVFIVLANRHVLEEHKQLLGTDRNFQMTKTEPSMLFLCHIVLD